MSNATQTTMSEAPYDDENPMPNAHSFCTLAGNPPVWGCTLCDWTFAITECNPSSNISSLDQAKIAHNKHSCTADQRRK